MIRVIVGDVREKLAELPDESVHCVVTSPPYFGLRDYGTASWLGGDPACAHESDGRWYTESTAASSSAGAFSEAGPANAERLKKGRWREKGACTKCGAVHADKQIGLEATPEAYVAVMVEVFREVRRVLRRDGTLWLNLGDSYSSGGRTTQAEPGEGVGHRGMRGEVKARPIDNAKPKDLLGIPWRVAFALQADGWTLRSEIIWHKPSAMPESVTDRPSKAHEQIFLLSRSPRYYYDAEAIAEPTEDNGRRNKRDVWTVASTPFSASHFATFPPALIEPCILAGCPKDCCAQCGAPVVRQTDEDRYPTRPGNAIKADASRNDGGRADRLMTLRITTGWVPFCACNAGTVPGTVLDCFGGAGTTGLVADRLQRDAILIELNPAYAAMAGNRITDDGPLFAEVGG